MSAARLGLGTVQFGLDYGVTNRSGRTDDDEAHRVLALARSTGIGTLDTAPRYGTAERVLGRAPGGLDGWCVVTKTAEYATDEDPRAAISSGLRGSLQRLGRNAVDVLLEHRGAALLGAGAEDVWAGLCAARDAGLAGRIGVSVYSPDELDAILARFPIEVVQAPVNVLDRRFVSEATLALLREHGVALHARSLMLQGTLVADPALSSHVPGLSELVVEFQSRCAAAGVDPLAACLAHSLSFEQIEVALVGVQSVAQLRGVLDALGRPAHAALEDLSTDVTEIVDPSTWPTREAVSG